MTNRTLALLIVIAAGAAGIALLIGWNGLFYSRAAAEHDLRVAKTATEERVAFDKIAKNSRVMFGLYDENGDFLGMSTSDWPKRAQVIEFYQFGDPPLKHTVINRENIYTLTRE